MYLRPFFIIHLILLLFSVKAFSQENKVRVAGSDLESVLVYRQGAEVKRTAVISYSAGLNDIVITGLSNFVNDKSIHISSADALNIVSVNYTVNLDRIKQRGSNWQVLSDSLDSVQLKFAYAKNEHYALDQEMQLLKENRKIAFPEKGIYVDDLEEAADFFRTRIQEIANKITLLEQLEKNLEKNIAEIEKSLAGSTDLNKNALGELHIRLNAATYGNSTLNISYETAKAGWNPIYSLNTQGEGEVTLDYDALVKQQTGENWTRALLSLSTSYLKTSIGLPTLAPWYIKLAKENTFLENDSLYQDSIQNVVASSGKTNYTFSIELPYNIASNAEPIRVLISQLKLPAKFYHLIMPSVSENSYIMAKIWNFDDNHLVAGSLNLYNGRTYAGKTILDPTTDKDTLNIYFGKGKSIITSREKIKENSKKSFIGNNIKEDFTYALTVQNNSTETADIVLEEHVPIPKSKEIEVKLDSWGNATFDSTKGKLRWELKLSPGQSQVLKYSYSVKFPKGSKIENLY